MVFNILSLFLAGLTISFLSGAKSTPCLPGTVAINVASAADIQTLADVMNCTGHGDFDVTWYSNQTLARTIEVANTKSLTVTGSGFPTIHGGLYDDNDDGAAVADAGGGTGIFSVSNGSTLRLSNLVIQGGNANNGGAIGLISSSYLFVYGCTLSNNNASYGGEMSTNLSLPRTGIHFIKTHAIQFTPVVLPPNISRAGHDVEGTLH